MLAFEGVEKQLSMLPLEGLARLPGGEDSSAKQNRVNACEVGKEWSKQGKQHERVHGSKGENGAYNTQLKTDL